MTCPATRGEWTCTARWQGSLRWLTAMALLGIFFGAVEKVLAQPHGLAAIHWQQRLFFIPYRFSQPTRAVSPVRKVQLLISRDGVSDWRILEEAEPNVQGFSYHAPEDGEYWFALRHLDRRGIPWPSATIQPQMRISVDTAQPELILSAALDATGEVVVRYEARDESLKPESLVIEIRPAGGDWSPVTAGPPDVSHADRLVGRAKWNEPCTADALDVRGSIADKAGNRVQATTEVTFSGPSFRMPSASNLGRNRGSFGVSGESLHSDQQVDPFQSAARTATQNWPADNRLQPATQSAVSGAESVAAANSRSAPPIHNPYSNPQAQEPSPRTPARLIAEGHPGSEPQRPPLAMPRTTDPPAENAPQDGWQPQPTATPDHGVRSVNSRTFDVEYDLQSIGPWGVSKVELWGTHDGGQTWQSFGVDNDNRSPMRVTVPDEGVYGFRILVDGANGAGSPPPPRGEKPELVVTVDLRPPTAELLGAQLGQGNMTGHLIIRFSASDTNLEPRPISLFYGTNPHGPWSTIAAGLENVESYTWRIERHVPHRFYLRLEARDVAGNLTATQSPSPIILTRPRPTGLLRGVRPVAADLPRYDTAGKGH